MHFYNTLIVLLLHSKLKNVDLMKTKSCFNHKKEDRNPLVNL